MTDFYPLILGLASSSGRNPDSQSIRQWSDRLQDLQPHLESAVLTRLREAAGLDRRGLWLLLGESGAGKTTLLKQWWRRWAGELGQPRLGLPVPVFVRLSGLKREHVSLDREAFADLLWQSAVDEHSSLSEFAQTIYRQSAARLYRPVWLIDELEEAVTLGHSLLGRLASLPGTKLLACQSATFRTLREGLVAYMADWAEYEIQPLTPERRTDIVAHRFQDQARAESLNKQITNSLRLATLAGNPRMLNLIMELASETPADAPISVSPALFYQRAVERMWTQASGSELRGSLRRQRDNVLIEMARKTVELQTIELEVSVFEDAIEAMGPNVSIGAALRKSGLLTVNDNNGTVRFFNRTFRDFYLARGLEEEDFEVTLRKHWNDPQFVETLAFLISRLSAKGEGKRVSASILKFIDWGRETKPQDREAWRGRSPLRVCLHLLRYSGAVLPAQEAFVNRVIPANWPARVAIASDHLVPPFLFTRLAQDPDREVRRSVAENRATLTETLAGLVLDRDPKVSSAAKKNTMVLETGSSLTLASRENRRNHVYGLPTTPEAFDVVPNEYRQAAWSSVVPPAKLSALARDPNPDIRLMVAGNPSTPPEALARLAADRYSEVRSAVAWNANAPPEVLFVLSRNRTAGMRLAASQDAAALPEILAAAARSGDVAERQKVASDRATPTKVLNNLANDETAVVRWSVARNEASPPDTLDRLARDDDEEVRLATAANIATPTKTLAHLAHDKEPNIRLAVFANNAVVIEDLIEIRGPALQSVRPEPSGNLALGGSRKLRTVVDSVPERGSGKKARDTSADGLRNKQERALLTRMQSFWSLVEKSPVLSRLFNNIVMDSLMLKLPMSPLAIGKNTSYVSWTSLNDDGELRRYLPPLLAADLPPFEALSRLFLVGPDGPRISENSTMLVSSFTQWLTICFQDNHDSDDSRRDYQIDLRQIYGSTPKITTALRQRCEQPGKRGRMKSEVIAGEEWPPRLFQPSGEQSIEFINVPAPSFDLHDWPIEKKLALFAFGSEKSNSSPFIAMLSVLFIREHNRLCKLVEESNPSWDDERVFETVRNINIFQLVKIVVEEYINHLSPYLFKIFLDPKVTRRARAMGQDWLALEIEMLYRWPSHNPDQVYWSNEARDLAKLSLDNRLLLRDGLAAAFHGASVTKAWQAGLFNTPAFLLPTMIAGIQRGRGNKLASYNDYRVFMQYPRMIRFEQISSDPNVIHALRQLYGHVDRVDLFVGLLAEEIQPNSTFPEMMERLIITDLLLRVMSNPLLSPALFHQTTFSSPGIQSIQKTSKLQDILERNAGYENSYFLASMNQLGQDQFQ